MDVRISSKTVPNHTCIVIDFTAKVVFTSYANLHRLLADADQQLSKKDKQTPLILDSHIIGASFIKKQTNSQSKV